jgi:hypothetical protein
MLNRIVPHMPKTGRRLAPVFFVLIAVVFVASCSRQVAETTDPKALRGWEARETLPPMAFTGPTARAYAIAKEIPEVLDSLHCYCECKKNYGHKSLLTCYVDEHAAHCDVCMDEAFMAYDLHKQGMDVIAIRRAVDSRFSKSRH